MLRQWYFKSKTSRSYFLHSHLQPPHAIAHYAHHTHHTHHTHHRRNGNCRVSITMKAYTVLALLLLALAGTCVYHKRHVLRAPRGRSNLDAHPRSISNAPPRRVWLPNQLHHPGIRNATRPVSQGKPGLHVVGLRCQKVAHSLLWYVMVRVLMHSRSLFHSSKHLSPNQQKFPTRPPRYCLMWAATRVTSRR